MARILVVDDDPGVCRTLTVLLHVHGHVVRTAASLAEGLQTLKHWPTEVVVTDFLFPAGGTSTVNALEKMLTGEFEAKVIVYTGISDAEIRERLTRLGVSRVFVKGSDSPYLLVDAVQRESSAIRHRKDASD